MQLISEVTVGSGGAASITFSAIPADYTDLYVVASLRTTRSGTIEGLVTKLNGSAANFTGRELAGAAIVFSSTFTNGRIGVVSAATSTANTFGNLSIYFPNYTSNVAKSFSADTVAENNAGGNFDFFNSILAGLWNDTAAINSIELIPGDGFNLVEHSSASLYGILAGSDGIVSVA